MVLEEFWFFLCFFLGHQGDPLENQQKLHFQFFFVHFGTQRTIFGSVCYFVGGGETDPKMVRWVPKWTKKN